MSFTPTNTATLILTANNRQATSLQGQYLANIQHIAEPLNILPLSRFLQQTWQAGQRRGQLPPDLLLSEAQRQYQFTCQLEKHQTQDLFLDNSGLAQQMLQAFKLCCDYDIPIAHLEKHLDEGDLFLALTQDFLKSCKDLKVISEAQIIPHLIDYWQQGGERPDHLTLYGLLDIPPRTQRLFDCLRQLGTTIEHHPLPQHNTDSRQMPCADSQTQWHAMAEACRAAIPHATPEAPYLCIVPQLQSQRVAILRALQKALGSDICKVNISAGDPLCEEGIIRTALEWLATKDTQLSHDAWRTLLQSPYLGDAETEAKARAHLSLALENIHELTLTRKTVLQFAGYAPLLKERLTAQGALHRTARLSPSDWAIQFSRELTALGWPGEQPLSSREYQAQQLWQDTLKNLCTFDALTPLATRFEALRLLNTLCQNRLFQPESAARPIQVLGVLEAAGLPACGVWLADCDSGQWPPSPSPNPFIPHALQRQYDLPHHSPGRTHQYYKQLTTGFIQQSPDFTASFSVQQNDTSTRVSPLLQHLTLTTPDTPPVPAAQTELLVDYQDWQGPSWQPGDSLVGGSALLTDQADCPFKGFAKGRLRARDKMPLQAGLSLAERGNLLHQSLYYFWQMTQSSEQLQAMSEAKLINTVNHVVARAIEHLRGQKPAQSRSHFMVIEKARLCRLLFEWLILEKQRAPFIVKSLEERYHSHFSGLPLTLQIDRIDELADGRLAIIDYKTGLARVSDWFHTPPRAAQLPLYSLSKPGVTACLYGEIQAGSIQIKGIAADPAQINETIAPIDKYGDYEDWEHLQAIWQASLSAVAGSILRGDAQPDPRLGLTTCSKCDVKSLCRLHDWQLPEAGDAST